MVSIEELSQEVDVDSWIVDNETTTLLNDGMHETATMDNKEQENNLQIQIYVPHLATKKSESTDDERIKSIKQNIRRTIKEKKTKLKQTTPISSRDESSNPPKKKQRVPAKTVSVVQLNFTLSESDMQFVRDKLGMVDPTESASKSKRPLLLFSLSDRLDDWCIENKQRYDGKCDPYYHHRKSKVVFRSTKEVENFVLFNAYPVNPQFEKKQKEEIIKLISQGSPNNGGETSGSHETIQWMEAYQEKQKTYKEAMQGDVKEKSQKEIVEEFLAEAFNNLQNYFNHDCQ